MRRPKPPIAAWIVENRKRLGFKPADLAARLDVAESTVRGWETGRPVSADHVAFLERVYGVTSPLAEPIDPAGQRELLDILRQQAGAMLAIAETLTKPQTPDRRMAEMPPAYLDDAGGIEETTANARRAYWIRRARERLAPPRRKIMSFDELADRLGLTGNARSLPASWQRGTRAVDPAYFERLARALHIPLRDIQFPPETDEERLDRWAREFSEVPPSETERPQTRQRRAS